MLCFAAIVPHPPIIIPEIGQNDLCGAEKTINALLRLSLLFSAARIDTVILLSPHAVILHDRIALGHASRGEGSFDFLGFPGVAQQYSNDTSLILDIRSYAAASKVATELYRSPELEDAVKLDHGILVPLYYFQKAVQRSFQIAVCSISDFTVNKHFSFGKALRSAIDAYPDKRIAVVASADLSHRLNDQTPYGFHADGKVFDEMLRHLLLEKNLEKIVQIDRDLVENAAACGYLPIVTLLGCLSFSDFSPELLSYEAPWGIGYAVMNMGL